MNFINRFFRVITKLHVFTAHCWRHHKERDIVLSSVRSTDEWDMVSLLGEHPVCSGQPE